MTTDDGNTILIPGYYDDVRPATVEESMLINALAKDWTGDEWKQGLGLSQFINGLEGADALMRYFYDVTLNVDGIWSGYTGEGTKTILPHIATAKMDSRLPLVFNGLGYGTGAHGPNEYMLIHPAEGSNAAGLADIEKSYVDLLFALSKSPAKPKN